MFGRTVSGFGSRAKRGAAPLSLSTQFNVGEGFLEIPAPGGQTIDTGAGDIDVTGTASGGTAPYSFAWTVTELSDNVNCAVLAAGTQNVANYNSLTLRTVIPSPPDPAEAQYRLRCTVTDSTTATATSDLTLTVVSIPL